jgi:hypothetical protein
MDGSPAFALLQTGFQARQWPTDPAPLSSWETFFVRTELVLTAAGLALYPIDNSFQVVDNNHVTQLQLASGAPRNQVLSNGCPIFIFCHHFPFSKYKVLVS